MLPPNKGVFCDLGDERSLVSLLQREVRVGEAGWDSTGGRFPREAKPRKPLTDSLGVSGEVRDRFSAESPADTRVVCVGRVRLGSALLCALCWHVCAVSVRAAALSKDGDRGRELSEGAGERSVGKVCC